MKTISNELKTQIISYCENNEIPFDWDYRAKLDKGQIQKILSSENGLSDITEELYELNMDCICELERGFIEYNLIPMFQNELEEELQEQDLNEIYDFCHENFMDYIHVNFSIDTLLPDNLTCLIVVYSNYDCTNSFDTMKDSDYLQQVYKRVKQGVKKSDFIWEHQNGAYGGSLFCFAFKTDLNSLIELKLRIKEGQAVKIPKGTQFGFFSSFQGSGSVFEKTTYKDMNINISENGEGYSPKYDNINIMADLEQSYSMADVYGDTEFISEQIVAIK